METRIELKQGWKILQDVHDTGEKTGLYAVREADTSVGSQVSEWEELEELKHLQLSMPDSHISGVTEIFQSGALVVQNRV